MIKNIHPVFLFVLLVTFSLSCTQTTSLQFFRPADFSIRITGRVDDSRADTIRFWQPGVQIEFSFKGDNCEIFVGDEIRWGSNHNYIELVVDGEAVRSMLKAASDTIRIQPRKKTEWHDVILMKNTEANIGYMDFYGVKAVAIKSPSEMPVKKFEFFGNSITCGASSDPSEIPCGAGKWQDQHNAWLAYGPRLGRLLNASVHLSSVSGIGLMHSCCDQEIIMPQVYDKVDMRGNRIDWDFSKYQPDIVFVCLGQNDGIQDSAAFVSNYNIFLDQLEVVYPNSRFILLSSPMADEKLRNWFKKILPAVAANMTKSADYYFFEKSYTGGCDYHPDINDHAAIAEELAKFLQQQ
ncbi:MAG: GDSL-type esterase/lipase family protein [Chitinophagaceae bacterium]|nr:GDSL-type esterase/lipase family protein [Chitinophagaceae bacterium]